MTFKIIEGDLFDPSHNFSALAQGVNCQGVMGAGIAVEFKNRFPEMYTNYQIRCHQFKDALAGLTHIYVNYDEPHIYNMFSQIMPGRNADIFLLRSSAIAVLMDAESTNIQSVGLPWIGAGIGGLEKHNVQAIFEYVFNDSDVDFVLVERPNG